MKFFCLVLSVFDANVNPCFISYNLKQNYYFFIDVALSQTTKTIKLHHDDDSTVFVAATFTFFITLSLAIAAGLSYFRNKKRLSSSALRGTYANAGYTGPRSVVIKLDPIGGFRPPSATSGSYATIASLTKFPMQDIMKTYSCKCGTLFLLYFTC